MAQVTPATPKHAPSNASEYDNAMARFTSTKKRNRGAEDATPVAPNSLPPGPAGTSTMRPLLISEDTPTKKPRLSSAPSTIIAACISDQSLSQDSFDDDEDIRGDDGDEDTMGDDDDDTSTAEPLHGSDTATGHGPHEVPTSDMPRPHCNRQPPKKYPEAV
ncbi:NADPH2:quinone reductase [Purpureocillium lavendulum]|uniref:NADPH2:quinone reductase n=1 Tax=Purpureocillium lavendulum TaxID=1247861 RepID=A0AB34FEZ5_9HYPO|nr:NADPH2:quinone reductase [Purpureocillium lavendulum]